MVVDESGHWWQTHLRLWTSPDAMQTCYDSPPGCFSPHAESWTIPLVDHHVPHYGGLYWPFLDPSCREASKYSSVYPTDIHVYAIIYVHVIYELACLYPFYNHVVIRKMLGSRTQLIHIDLGSPWFLSGGCWFNGGWDYIVVSLYHYIYIHIIFNIAIVFLGNEGSQRSLCVKAASKFSPIGNGQPKTFASRTKKVRKKHLQIPGLSMCFPTCQVLGLNHH